MYQLADREAAVLAKSCPLLREMVTMPSDAGKQGELLMQSSYVSEGARSVSLNQRKIFFALFWHQDTPTKPCAGLFWDENGLINESEYDKLIVDIMALQGPLVRLVAQV